MKNIGIIIDNDFYSDIRVMNEIRVLNEHFTVFVLCFRFDKSRFRPHNIKKLNNIVVKTVYINRKLKNILFGIQNTLPLYNLFWIYHINKFIKQYSLSTIHLHDLYMAEIGWKVKQKTGVKFILDLHENYPEAVLHYKWANKTWKKWLAKPYKWAINEKRLLAYADKIIVVHDDLQTCLVDKYPELSEKISIFPNVPDLEEFSSYPTDINVFEKGNKFVLFYFGIISEQRGIVTCVNAINVLKLIYPNIHLLLIGPILNSEKTIFRDILDNDHITHLDWIDISLFPSYAHISDVCINPLRKIKAHETTFANKIYQYALSQKPLLVSDCKPLKDFIEKYNCGLVFKADDTTDLANKIEYLLNNPDKCEEYGKNGRKAVMEKYNVKMLGMNLLASYR